MKKILIIEDNDEVRENLEEILDLYGYDTETAENGKVGIEKAITNPPDLILCDIMMPELDGFGTLNILSKKPATADIPFVFLTAKSEKEDFRRGMNLGADDYVIKPAEPRVLLARVNALLRRGQTVTKTSEELQFGDLIIDKTSRIVQLSDKEIVLTSHEFELLWLLASNAGQVLSREHVHQHMIGRQYDGLDRTVDVRVSRIRKKLGDNSDKPFRIKTVWGQGYLFVSDAWDL